MTDRLKYGFESGRLSLEAPKELFELVGASDDRFQEIVTRSKTGKTIDVEQGDNDVLLSFNTKKAGNSPDSQVRRHRSDELTYVLESLNAFAMPEQADPLLTVWMGSIPVGYGDIGMHAWTVWPEEEPDILLERINPIMQRIAVELQTMPQRVVKKGVSAKISREYGLTFEANDVGSCSLDTDGSDYNPQDTAIELYGHNIYSPEIQLICLSGLIAFIRP